MNKKLALFGYPIHHSLSPKLHRLFAMQFGVDIDYELIEATEESFPEKFQDFLNRGGVGGNFTMPLKQVAYSLIPEKTSRALLANAVNTFYIKEQILCADNTDGLGLVNDLKKAHWPLNGASVLIVGRGAVAKSIVAPLKLAGVASVIFGVRDLESIQTIEDTVHLNNIHQSYDIIINATSASLDGTFIELDPICFNNAYVYDVVYKKDSGAFLTTAKAHGAKAIRDGLGMLIEQGALGFEDWFGHKPNTHGLAEKLRLDQ